MILAAPLVIPFSKAVPALAGLTGILGMAALSEKVNEYIQENPEESMKILSTIIPNVGIGQIFMSKEDKISLEDLEDMTDEEAQDLSKEEKAELMKQAGKRRNRELSISTAEKIGLTYPDREKQDIEYDVDKRYDEGGVEQKKAPFDYKRFFRKRRADGGAIRKNFSNGGDSDKDTREFQNKYIQAAIKLASDKNIGIGDAMMITSDEDFDIDNMEYKGSSKGILEILNQKADGGAIGIEVLFEEKKPRKNFRVGGASGREYGATTKASQSVKTSSNRPDRDDRGPTLVAELTPKQKKFIDKQKFGLQENLVPARDIFNKITNPKLGIFDTGTFGFGAQEPTTEEEFNEYLKSIGVVQQVKDGGRVGFNLGGLLTGQAKSIYDSMMAAGYFTEDEIRNAIIGAGYEIPGASPAQSEQVTGIINQQLQTGGGRDDNQTGFGKFGNLDPTTERTFVKDVYTIDKNAAPGAPMTGSFKPTEVTGYLNVNTGNYQTLEGKNINHAGLNVKPGIVAVAEALGLGPIDETQFTGLPYKEGQIAGTFTGKKLSDFNPFNLFKKQQATLADINAMNKKAVDELRAKQAAEKAAKEAAIAAEMARYNITSGSDFGGGVPGGGGGNVRTSGGDVYGGAAYGYNEAAEKTDYYRDGGLATMFREKR